MLRNFVPIFSRNLIDGLSANKQKLRQYIENSPVIVTLLSPKLGYQTSAELYKESLKTGRTIRQLVISKGLLSEKQVKALLG
jgi:aspartate ammonia-lyase